MVIADQLNMAIRRYIRRLLKVDAKGLVFSLQVTSSKGAHEFLKGSKFNMPFLLTGLNACLKRLKIDKFAVSIIYKITYYE